MSYDADYESVYMVEFDSGKTIHVQLFDIEEVKEYCRDMYPKDTIKTIYKEVYNSLEGDEDDGQPDEQQEWESFDPDC